MDSGYRIRIGNGGIRDEGGKWVRDEVSLNSIKKKIIVKIKSEGVMESESVGSGVKGTPKKVHTDYSHQKDSYRELYSSEHSIPEAERRIDVGPNIRRKLFLTTKGGSILRNTQTSVKKPPTTEPFNSPKIMKRHSNKLQPLDLNSFDIPVSPFVLEELSKVLTTGNSTVPTAYQSPSKRSPQKLQTSASFKNLSIQSPKQLPSPKGPHPKKITFFACQDPPSPKKPPEFKKSNDLSPKSKKSSPTSSPRRLFANKQPKAHGEEYSARMDQCSEIAMIVNYMKALSFEDSKIYEMVEEKFKSDSIFLLLLFDHSKKIINPCTAKAIYKLVFEKNETVLPSREAEFMKMKAQRHIQQGTTTSLLGNILSNPRVKEDPEVASGYSNSRSKERPQKICGASFVSRASGAIS